MVWRQLPKLVPAGSIPVSCSKRKGVRRYSGGRLFVVAETFCYSASSRRISSRPSPRKTPAFFAFSSSYAGAPAYPFSLS